MELKEQVMFEVDQLRDELVETSEYIHANPELANEEYKASKALTSLLEKHGFEVQLGYGTLDTAFRAVKQGKPGGPVIGLLCEYDALPEMGHACGHNLIGTISTGAAIAVSKVLDEVEGTLVVLGTPAEEGGGGKVIMIGEGCMDELDCAMIIHPTDRTMVQDISLANATLVYNFHGKSAHAAAFPHEGVNALEAVIQTFNNINGLRCHLKDDIRVHGIITKGGIATNIVTDLAECKFSVRALKRADLDAAVKKINRCAEAAALATGCTVDITTEGFSYDEIMNNQSLMDTLEANFVALGEKIYPRLKEEGMGSTDMGNVTQIMPGFQSYIGIGEGAVTHTPGFTEMCCGENGARSLMLATKALAMTTIDVLTNKEILEKAKAEFVAIKGE